jgi:hypothetical protein
VGDGERPRLLKAETPAHPSLKGGAEYQASPRAETAWPSGSVRRLGNSRRNEDDDRQPSHRHLKC